MQIDKKNNLFIVYISYLDKEVPAKIPYINISSFLLIFLIVLQYNVQLNIDES